MGAWTEQDRREQVEINIFEGEGAADLAAHVRAFGSTVVATDSWVVVAAVSLAAIGELAGDQVRACSRFNCPASRNCTTTRQR